MPPLTEYVPDSQVLDNQARAKALGINIPGLSTAPATSGVGTTQPTMESAGFTAPAISNDSEADRLQRELYNSTSETEDVSDIRSRYISMFQDQVNALNDVYDQQLSRAQAQGVGRVGQGTAILARRGLGGSPRGQAIQEGVLDQNREIEGAIQAERNTAIQAIYGEATKLAVDEAKERRAAKELGTQNYITYLRTQEERKATNTAAIVQALIAQGIDPATMTPEDLQRVAKELKVTPEQLIGSYKVAKVAEDKALAEKERADAIEDEKNALEQRKVDIDEAYKNKTISLDERRLALDQLKADREAAEKAETAATPVDVAAQIQFLKTTAESAKNLASAAGPSFVTREAGDFFVGNSEFRQLEQQLKTLQSNMLTLATDPNIKKFFGPQMSNADVNQMLAAGTSLNAQSNTPEQIVAEIERIEGIFNRLEGVASSASTPTNTVTAPDGTQVEIID